MQSPSMRERPVMKSCSTGRVPRSYGIGAINHRSISCERPRGEMSLFRTKNGESGPSPRGGPNGYGNSSYNRNQIQQPRLDQSKRSNSTLSASKTNPPSRSLSASGTAEFYGRGRGVSNLRGENGKVRANAVTVPASKLGGKVQGKNTWSGPNPSNGSLGGRSSRARPNLFRSNFFNPEEPIRTDSNESEISDSSGEGRSNLAEWIKKALELESDADKISHIELAIKQFEKQSRQESPDSTNSSILANSLPYNNSCTNNSLITVRKRKENGSTKIPKPSFY